MRIFITLLYKSIFVLIALIPAGFCVAQYHGHNILYGKLIDADSQKSLDDVTIQVLFSERKTGSNQKIIATQFSNKKGEFLFNKIPGEGTALLMFSRLGYKTFSFSVSFNNADGQVVKDIGNIRLFRDTAQLDEITINSKKPLIELQPDKTIYNPEKDISVNGGTTLDIVRNMPGVNVDPNNNVFVRNAPALIFIDGRPSVLQLNQVPAEQVSVVELMTNPSARYDAGGSGAGIINIVLKKNKRTGYNGSLRTGIDNRPRPYVGGDFNVMQNKVNFFASAQLSTRKNIISTATDRLEYTNNAVVESTQKGSPVNKGYYGFGRTGIDFFVSNRTTISLSGNYSKGNFKVTDLLRIQRDTLYSMLQASESVRRILKADIDYKSIGGGLSLKHNFSADGKELTADIHFNQNKNYNRSDYSSRLFDANGNERPAPGAERAIGGGTTNFYTIQTDFVNPVTKNSKFESGLRLVGRHYTSFNNNFRQNISSGNYTPLTATDIFFDFSDRVYAVYGMFSQKIKSFNYQLGLRAESSSYNGELVNKNEFLKNNFPISLFPSLFLNRQLENNTSLQLNYSRKTNRPGFFHILPFVDFSDSLNLFRGNPSLRPEFSNMVEISFQKIYKTENVFLATIYGRQSSDLLTRYQSKDKNPDPAGSDSVIFISYINAKKSHAAGLELIGRNKFANWWQVNSNINFFNVHIESDNIPSLSKINRWSLFVKVNNSFALPQRFTFQLNAEYLTKTILSTINTSNSLGGFGGGIYGSTQNTAQGYLKPVYGVDVSVKKDFLKDKSLTVTMQWNDILRSRKYQSHIDTHFVVQDNSVLRDPQLVRLNVAWRFGKPDASLLRRKNKKAEQESLQRVQQGV